MAWRTRGPSLGSLAGERLLPGQFLQPWCWALISFRAPSSVMLLCFPSQVSIPLSSKEIALQPRGVDTDPTPAQQTFSPPHLWKAPFHGTELAMWACPSVFYTAWDWTLRVECSHCGPQEEKIPTPYQRHIGEVAENCWESECRHHSCLP